MIQKNTSGRGRKSKASSAKPDKNRATKKTNPATKSPAKKQWSKGKGGSPDAIKKEDRQSGNDYPKARAGFGKGERKARVDHRPGADAGPLQAAAAGEVTATPNQPPRPGSFKTYRKNYKNNKGDSRNNTGAAAEKNPNAKGEDGSGNAGSQAAKGKGNPKRDAFSKRQSGAAKPTRFEKDREEQSFDNKVDRKPSTKQNRTSGAKPSDTRHKPARRTKPADRKTPTRPAGKKRAPSKRRK